MASIHVPFHVDEHTAVSGRSKVHLISRVFPDVGGHSLSKCKSSPTNGAFERLFASVHPKVFRFGLFAGEFLSTDGALEGFLACVMPHVFSDIALL